MQSILKINPLVRAVLVIAAVAALATGVTFAALNSQATLTSNTLESADANLLIWNGSTFASTALGFDVNGLVPGEGSDENFFYLQNAGEGNLNLTVHVPVEPAVPGGGYGFSGWENLEVTFKSYKPGCVTNTVSTNMSALLAGNVALPCNSFAEGAAGDTNVAGTEGNYSVKFDINPASITGDHADVGSFDFVFDGSVLPLP